MFGPPDDYSCGHKVVMLVVPDGPGLCLALVFDRTVGLCMVFNRILNFHVVRSTRPCQFTPAPGRQSIRAEIGSSLHAPLSIAQARTRSGDA